MITLTPMLVVACVVLYVAGGVLLNVWATKRFPDSGWGKVCVLVSAPACIAALLAAGLVCVIAHPFAASIHHKRERQFAQRMQSAGRFKPWDQIERQRGSGTIIVEQANKDARRVWWTAENVADLAPHQIPDEADLDYLRLEAPTPFAQWCAERYTSPSTGNAVLTEFPFAGPPGFLTAEFVNTKLPDANVVVTVKPVS